MYKLVNFFGGGGGSFGFLGGSQKFDLRGSPEFFWATPTEF